MLSARFRASRFRPTAPCLTPGPRTSWPRPRSTASPGEGATRDEIVLNVTVGIAVFESALTALRLLAEEDATARRFGLMAEG